MNAETIDDFLGGRVRLIQPASGYRAAMDTVLVAAAMPVRTGDHVLELGIGSAGASLCLAARVPGVILTGLDISSDMIALAARNAALNAVALHLVAGDVSTLAIEPPEGGFCHVMANPPFLDPARHDAPPDAAKAGAHMGAASLEDWVKAAHRLVRPRGTFTLIHRADHLPKALSLMAARFGDLALFPLWPRAGLPAKRFILQGRRDSKGSARILAGLVLHDGENRYSAAAEQVLRHGAALKL